MDEGEGSMTPLYPFHPKRELVRQLRLRFPGFKVGRRKVGELRAIWAKTSPIWIRTVP